MVGTGCARPAHPGAAPAGRIAGRVGPGDPGRRVGSMSYRYRWTCRAAIWAGLCLLGGAGPGVAQSPAEPEVLLNASQPAGDQFPVDLACQRNGPCVCLWDFGVFSATDP